MLPRLRLGWLWCCWLGLIFILNDVTAEVLSRNARQLINCRNQGALDVSTGVRAFLTVSSPASADGGRIVERQLELNWHQASPASGDWVGLFKQDPSSFPLAPLDKSDVAGRQQGTYRTAVTFPRPTFSSRSLRSECLGYWAAYVRGNRTLSATCLRNRPTWMWDNRQTLGAMRLRDLLIPGTHDSGSYQEYKGRPSENVITRYTITQDENIWNQLAYGNRFLDFRIGLYRTTPERFWLNHGDFKINPLRDAIRDLSTFVNSTNEVVIVDFHRFPWGFDSPEQHRELLTFLLQELEPFLLPRAAGNDVTLNDIWGTNRRVLLSYNDPTFLQNDLLWSGIPQRWGDKNDVGALKGYLDNTMRISNPQLWAAMAELTPTTGDIISNPTGSLRNLADKVNHNVTEWFRELWWDKANIVATDFFLANNMIDIAIEANLKRKMCWERSLPPASPFNPRPSVRPNDWQADRFNPPNQPRPTPSWVPASQQPSWNPAPTPGPPARLPPSWNSPPKVNPAPPGWNSLQRPQFPGPGPSWGSGRYPPPIPQPVVSGLPPYHQNWINRIEPQPPFPPPPPPQPGWDISRSGSPWGQNWGQPLLPAVNYPPYFYSMGKK